MDDDRGRSPPGEISATFRNGSVTVVGVLAAFSLTYVTAWAANPVPWGLNHLFGFVPLVIGIALQLLALAALLEPSSLESPRYRRAIRIFLVGMSLVTIGVIVTLAIDVITLAADEGG